MGQLLLADEHHQEAKLKSASRKTDMNKSWWKTALPSLAGIALALAFTQVSVIPAQAQSAASQPAPQDQKPAPAQDIPDAPSVVQPPVPSFPTNLPPAPANKRGDE